MTAGDRFDLAGEGVHGYVAEVILDEDGDPCSVVVELDGGGWAAVELRWLERAPIVLH